MDLDIDGCVRSWLSGSHWEQAHVFVDDEVFDGLTNFVAYMLESLHVARFSPLRSDPDPLAWNPATSSKAVFLIPRFVQEQTALIASLLARGGFQSAVVCTPLTQAAHLQAYSQGFDACARSIMEEAAHLGSRKLKVVVQTLPVIARSLFSGVLLLPPSASVTKLFPPPMLAPSMPSLPSSLSALPAALQAGFGKTKCVSTLVCAQYLASLCTQLSWTPDIFSLGSDGEAREIADAFAAASPLPTQPQESSASRVSFVLLERRWDLVSPCSHSENVLDYIVGLSDTFSSLDPVSDALHTFKFLSLPTSSSRTSSSTSSSSDSSAPPSFVCPASLPARASESKCPPLPPFITEMLVDLQPLARGPILGPHLLCFSRTQSKEAAMLTEALLTFPERDAVATLCKLLLTVFKKHNIALPPAPPKATPMEKARVLLQVLWQSSEGLWQHQALAKCALLVVASVEAAHQLHWPMLRALEASMTLEGVGDDSLSRIADLLDHVSLEEVLGQACYAYSLRGSAGFSPEAEADFVSRVAAKLGKGDAVDVVDGWKQRLQEVGFAREVQGLLSPSLLTLQGPEGYTPLVVRLLNLLLPPEGFPSPLPELHWHNSLKAHVKEASAKEVVGGLFAAGKMFTSKLLQGVRDVGRHPADNSTLVVFVVGGVTVQEMGAVQQLRLKHPNRQIYLGATGVCSLRWGVSQALTPITLG